MFCGEDDRQSQRQMTRMVGGSGSVSAAGSGGWVVALLMAPLVAPLAATATMASGVADEGVGNNSGNATEFNFDDQVKQVMWKKCALQLTPTCLKLTLARLVDRLSQDTLYHPLPGVTLSSNRSRAALEPPDPLPAGGRDLSLADRLDGYLRHRVASYLRSLTLTVRPFHLPLVNTTTLLDTVVDKVSGRKKDNVGLGAVALMMGGAMMTMMMSALAALAGKAMMTSMMALMLAAMSALKGGGGGGGGKSTTYEIIAQPHHSDHGWKRSVDTAQAHLRRPAHWAALAS